MQRRHFIGTLGALAAMAGLDGTARAQPLDRAKILVGFAPGGLSDILARQLADAMHPRYANVIVVENKTGASGQIAVAQAKDAPPDGTVLLLTHSSSLSMYPFTFAHLPYKPLQDFKPVSSVCYANHALCVGRAVPDAVHDMKTFIQWCKANPSTSNCGVPGIGSMPNLIIAMVNQAAGTHIQNISYRGTAPAISDLLGGQVSAACGPAANFLPMARAGKIRMIAISGEARSDYAPDVATFREQGYAINAREWYGLFLPAGAGADVVERASRAARAAIDDPRMIAKMKDSGAQLASSTPGELAAMLAADTAEWRTITKQLHFTAES